MMRHWIVATGFLVIAASAQAQTPAATDTAATPALIKSVAIDPNDSPLVRAAKHAVASRQNAGSRRIVTVNSSHGHYAQATGPTNGPSLPATDSGAQATKAAGPSAEQQAAAKRQGEVQNRLRQLAQEEQRVGAELDEPYGGDIEEDAVEKRLSDIAAERQRLAQPPPPPPQR
jgi:hypothetical protein